GLSVRAVEEIVALGESEPATRQPRARRPVAPAVAGLAERLSDVLETRVSVELGRRRGKLVVQFATIDDLERIVAQIAPAALREVRCVAGDQASAGAGQRTGEEVTGW